MAIALHMVKWVHSIPLQFQALVTLQPRLSPLICATSEVSKLLTYEAFQNFIKKLYLYDPLRVNWCNGLWVATKILNLFGQSLELI